MSRPTSPRVRVTGRSAVRARAVLVVMALGLLAAGPASSAGAAAPGTGTISGTVVGPGGPAFGVTVRAYESSTGNGGNVLTDAAGVYHLTGLPAGQYTVEFDGMTTGLVSEYYADHLQWVDADPVTVTAGGDTTGIDAVLAPGGGISGTVTGPAGPAASVWVSATSASYYEGAYTAADGTYHLVGLLPGSYRIQFNGVFAGLASEYYDDTLLWAQAEPVDVVTGFTTVGIDAALVDAGSISGVVRGPAGPLEGAIVSAYDLEGGGYGNVATVADGSYRIDGLPAGSYTIRFQGPDGAALRMEFHANQVTERTATAVTLAAGQDRAGFDAVLAPEADPLFVDVPHTAPFHGQIEWLAQMGITARYPDGTFRPSAPVERQAMAAFLYRYAGEPVFTPPSTPSFTDVPVGAPFYTEVEWLASTGVTTGWPDGTFRPTATVERQAMAAFLYRYAGEPAFTPPATATFSDVPTSATFFDEVEWLASTGITTGWPDGTFRPTARVERQAMAAFLMRFAAWLDA